jgi:hypothetical protein
MNIIEQPLAATETGLLYVFFLTCFAREGSMGMPRSCTSYMHSYPLKEGENDWT